MEPWREELYHHGILGQKWGVRNGPPYALDREEHTAEERKMGWRRSLGKGRNEHLYDRNEAHDARVRYWKKKGMSQRQAEQRANRKTTNRKEEAQVKEKRGLADNQTKETIKKVAVGVGVTAAVAAVAIGSAYVFKKGLWDANYMALSMKHISSKVDPEVMGVVDQIFEAGSEFHRISAKEVVNLAKDKLYSTTNEEDRLRYAGKMREFYKQWARQGIPIDPGKMWDVKLKSLTEIRSPSERKRFDILADLLKNDDNFVRNIQRFYDDQGYPFTENYYKTDEFAKKFYNTFVLLFQVDSEQAPHMKSAVDQYFDKVKSLGYNALVDDNDRGVFSEKPIIFLDPINTVTQEGAKYINRLDEFMAVMKRKMV